MDIGLVGVNHHTAGFDVLERVSAAVPSLPQRLGTEESVTLATCNRAEIWTAGELAPDAIVEKLAHAAGMSVRDLRPHIYGRTGIDAARHAMRVAAGLDSLILGEAQILGQVARALDDARASGTAGPLVTRLCLAAVQAGRRARTETEIGRHTASVSHAAAALAAKAVDDVRSAHFLLVGSGEAAELAAQALRHRGVRHLVVTGRTEANTRRLAERIDGAVLPWIQLTDGIRAADVVVSATAAPETVIGPADIVAREGRPLTLIDLAVPHDVDAAVEQISKVSRFDLDDLRSVVDLGRARRKAAIPAVEAIIEDELEHFRKWFEGRRVIPVIVELREHVLELVRGEMREALDRLGYRDATQAADRLANRIATKVLHKPVTRLKARAECDGAAAHVAAIRDLFDLTSSGQEGDAA
jgi:glutamyl-tRNA reductase